jgi:hypothetical protein
MHEYTCKNGLVAVLRAEHTLQAMQPSEQRTAVLVWQSKIMVLFK